MNCPSCGRPIEFEEKYLKVAGCPYCNSILEFGGSELIKIGEQSDFIDFPTIFKVGKEIEWEGKKVYVKGQLRYEYDGGFFDKFFVLIDGKEYFIEEDDGTQKLLNDGKWQKSTVTIMDKPVGETVQIGGKEIFIQEIGILKLVNIKGFVNNTLIPGKEYQYLDGIVDGKMIYLEKESGVDRVRIINEIKSHK